MPQRVSATQRRPVCRRDVAGARGPGLARRVEALPELIACGAAGGARVLRNAGPHQTSMYLNTPSSRARMRANSPW